MEFINKYPEIDFYARDEVSDEQSANRYLNEIISRYSLSFEKNICLLQVTCPLRLVLDIRTATDTYKFGYGDTQLNGLLSVTKTKPSNKMYTLDEYKISPYCSKVVDLYYRNSSIYIFNVGSFLYFNGLDCIYNEPNVGSYIMPAERSIDIDTMEDFNLAEMLIRGGVLDVANHA
jgi:CMP-N-acetylneuraminic acid synthetase